MTVKPESNFWRLLKKHIPAYWDRIENRHGGGTPDLIGIREGVTIFIELKCIKQNSINISPLQISRNINIFQHGGKNYYLVQDTRSKVIKLYNGDKGRELKEKGFLYDGDIKFSDPINWKKLSPIDWKWLGDRLFS
mgnify:CR=1 FL=1